MSTMKNFFQLIVAGILAFSLIACSSTDEDNVDVSTEQAQTQATKALYSGLSKNLGKVNSNLFSTEGKSLINSLTSNSQVASVIGQDNVTTLQNATSVSDLAGLAGSGGTGSGTNLEQYIPDEYSSEAEDQFSAQVAQYAGMLFNPPARSGNTITYTFINEVVQETCTDEDTLQVDSDCVIVLGTMSIQQNLTSETSGTLSLVLGTSVPITLGYSDTDVYVEVNLGSIKTVLALLDELMADPGDEPTTLPDTFTGAVRLTLSAPTETDISLSVGITQALNIAGDFDGDELNMTLAQSPNLLVFAASETSTSFSLDMGAMSATAEDSGASAGDPVWTQISTGGIAADISMDEDGEMTISNAGITNDLIMKFGDTKTSLDDELSISLASFSGTQSSDGSMFTFTSAFELGIDMTDTTGMFTDITGIALTEPSGMSFTMPANTEIAALGGTLLDDTSVPQVVSGSLTVTGTGDLDGTLTANAGECIGEGSSFIMEIVTCP